MKKKIISIVLFLVASLATLVFIVHFKERNEAKMLDIAVYEAEDFFEERDIDTSLFEGPLILQQKEYSSFIWYKIIPSDSISLELRVNKNPSSNIMKLHGKETSWGALFGSKHKRQSQ